MAFSVVSWNVEFFGSRRRGETDTRVRNRISRVFDLLATPAVQADVFAIYEVNGGQVFGPVQARFPDYTWQISDGGGSQRILVGSRLPGTFVTVRAEFSQGFSGPLRPGILVTVPHQGQNFPMLFLHLKAADVPVDFGVRAFQHAKVRSLRKTLDDSDPNGQANFIVAGDYNSVGLDLSFSPADISQAEENARLATMYGSRFDHMPVWSKTHPETFWNGPGTGPTSDIDHVAAATRVNFAQVNGADIEVKGWPELATDAEKGRWIDQFSDHAILRYTVV